MSSEAGLCTDVLQEIFERIPLHSEILRYAAVSKQWRSIVMDNLHRLPQNLPFRYCLPCQNPLPLLMQCNDGEDVGKLNFLSVVDNKCFNDFILRELSGNWIAGSSNGCLVLNDILGQKIHLLNPLTRAQISLPSLSTFKRLKFFNDPIGDISNKLAYIRRALVLSEPNTRSLDGCIVIAIVSHWHVLSFCRPGDDKWTNIEGSPLFVNDVICFKGQLYAVALCGGLLRFDLEHQGVVCVAGHALNDQESGKRYLVESTSGQLLLVLRIRARGSYSTSNFYVFKLEEVDEAQDGVILTHYRVEQAVKYKWVKLERLDDQILCIGRNSSKSVPASLYPGLKGNCIYFTDDDLDNKRVRVTRAKAGDDDENDKVEKYDMGIYDMEDESIRPTGLMDDNKHFRVPPVWVEPNLWLKQ